MRSHYQTMREYRNNQQKLENPNFSKNIKKEIKHETLESKEVPKAHKISKEIKPLDERTLSTQHFKPLQEKFINVWHHIYDMIENEKKIYGLEELFRNPKEEALILSKEQRFQKWRKSINFLSILKKIDYFKYAKNTNRFRDLVMRHYGVKEGDIFPDLNKTLQKKKSDNHEKIHKKVSTKMLIKPSSKKIQIGIRSKSVNSSTESSFHLFNNDIFSVNSNPVKFINLLASNQGKQNEEAKLKKSSALKLKKIKKMIEEDNMKSLKEAKNEIHNDNLKLLNPKIEIPKKSLISSCFDNCFVRMGKTKVLIEDALKRTKDYKSDLFTKSRTTTARLSIPKNYARKEDLNKPIEANLKLFFRKCKTLQRRCSQDLRIVKSSKIVFRNKINNINTISNESKRIKKYLTGSAFQTLKSQRAFIYGKNMQGHFLFIKKNQEDKPTRFVSSINFHKGVASQPKSSFKRHSSI